MEATGPEFWGAVAGALGLLGGYWSRGYKERDSIREMLEKRLNQADAAVVESRKAGEELSRTLDLAQEESRTWRTKAEICDSRCGELQREKARTRRYIGVLQRQLRNLGHAPTREDDVSRDSQG